MYTRKSEGPRNKNKSNVYQIHNLLNYLKISHEDHGSVRKIGITKNNNNKSGKTLILHRGCLQV